MPSANSCVQPDPRKPRRVRNRRAAGAFGIMRPVQAFLRYPGVAVLAFAAVAGLGCGEWRLPRGPAPGPEPEFLWGICNPATAAEVADLAGPQPFLVRLDSPFTGGRPTLRSARALEELRVHREVRFMVVLPYRPQADATPDDWSAFVRRAVEYYGRQPAVRYLQITQGINSPAYADLAGDRAPFARQALLDGLRVAAETRARTGADLRLGFSVYVGTGATPAALMQWLRRAPDAMEAVDWVGIDCYPGTGLLCLESGAADALNDVLRRARAEWLPLADLGDVPLILTQLGVATVAQVSPEAQGRWVDVLVTTAWAARDRVNLGAVCWYEARDRDTSATVLAGPRRYVGSHFGLSTSAGWRKDGFATLRARVATLQPVRARDRVLN